MKWYSVELTQKEWIALRPALKKSGFRFEKSDADLETMVYISVYAAPENVNFINAMIDKIL